MANASLEGLRRRWQRFCQPGTAQLRIHLPGQPTRLPADIRQFNNQFFPSENLVK